jgi:MerR family redox-sensitive transcriptional activator SoxR
MTGVSILATTLSIGQVAERSGVSHTTLRFYEDAGLISAERTAGNQRRYPRSVLRQLAFIRTAQRVGLTLDQIREALATLPEGRTPSKSDWAKLSQSWQTELDARIDALHRLRDRLTSCIGCGCLSLRTCALYNHDDEMAAYGPGAPKLRAASEGGCD